MFIGNINIDSLLKAFSMFKQYSKIASSPLEKTGLVQAFEYTFELCWKTMKRLLDERGKSLNSPREVLRAAALEGFIEDPETWFNFLKKRNLTVHSYNTEYLEEIVAICPEFSHEVSSFLKKIGVPENAYGK